MVPIPESIYFPPLERCLDGRELLISWKTTFVSLTESPEQSSGHLENFLLDPYVQNLLADAFVSCPKATTETKSAFETKTAAINVTPTAESVYNIAEIKEDALWLSKKVEIDEISALRLIVLEYQTRSSAQLLRDFSAEEAASLHEAAGGINTDTSIWVSRTLLSNGVVPGDKPTPFDSQTGRRVRALQLLLSERRHFLNCAQLFLQNGISNMSRALSSNEKGKDKQREELLIERLGDILIDSLKRPGTGYRQMILRCIESIQRTTTGLDKGSGWLEGDNAQQEMFEMDWLATQLIEVIRILEAVIWLIQAEGPDRLQSTAVVLGWFRMVEQYDFFEHFSSVQATLLPIASTVQSLVAMISFAMINPSGSLEYLGSLQGNTISQGDSDYQPYVLDLDAVATLHRVFVQTADGPSPIASPTIFGWAIFLRTVRGISTERREARELKQSQRAVDDFGDDSFTEEEVAPDGGFQRRRRRASASSELSVEGGIFDDIMDRIVDRSSPEDDIEQLARSAVDGSHVFDALTAIALNTTEITESTSRKIRCDVLESARCFFSVVGYIPEIFNTILSALTGGQDFWDLTSHDKVPDEADPLVLFLLSDELRENTLGTAMSRYPYERLPFLKIVRAVAACESLHNEGTPVIMRSLEVLSSFTYELPQGFRDYEAIHEEDNTNTIQLTQSVMLFEPRNNMRSIMEGSYSTSQALVKTSDDFCIPAGTPGRIVSDSGPKIAVWFHEYSGLRYLGKLVETALAAGEYVDATIQQEADHESLVEIIGLMATLLVTSTKLERTSSGKIDPQGPSHRLLEEASDGLSRNRDIVSVIFSLFDEQLQSQSDGTGTDATLELLVVSMQFVYALVPILPGRVWSFLGRSRLLELDGRGGKLSSVLTSTELVTGRFDLLSSCMHLLGALVQDSTTHAVLRKSGSKTMTRFGTMEALGTGVPDHILSKVLCSLTRIAVDVFLNACNWKFAALEQRLILSETVATVLKDILHHTHGVDDLQEPKSKLAGVLAPAAEYIIDNFLSESSGHLRFQPILRALLDGFSSPEPTSQAPIPKHWRTYVKAVLQLTITLVNLSTFLNRTESQLERLLFTVSPLVARLYAVHDSYTLPVIRLLESLVISAANGSGEPPSLLGHLGPQTSKNFLHIVSELGKPVDDDAHAVAIWKLMSSVVSNRQQWFAIYLLTGRTPRETLKETADKAATSAATPLLTVALDELSHIQDVPLPRALAMLQFISLAQNFWPWAMSDLHKKPGFITAISDYVEKIPETRDSGDTKAITDSSYQIRIAAYVAEILAMHLYHSRQIGNIEPAKDVIKKISFYKRTAVSVPSYNSSLHSNLRKNFEAKFRGCTLQDFKRTSLESGDFGPEYFYNIELANKMLSSDQAWLGKKNDGLAEEMARANVNLSLVDAQVAVLHGWKMLAVELSTNINDVIVQGVLAKTVTDCLISNIRTSLHENVFTQLRQTRADFALILFQRLTEAKCRIEEVLKLLTTVWQAFRTLNSSFEMALASGDASYYRSLLKILYLALQAHAGSDGITPGIGSNSPTSQEAPGQSHTFNARVELVLEILDKVVARGFHDLQKAIHEQPGESTPGDIALITAILQACLRIPGLDLRHNQILTSMAAHDIARAATTLFSWSDKLAVDGDPIYGELSIQFLLELSSIPTMAEQLAIEGVLGHISNASITSYIRGANISPFADGAGPQRCYNIWARGILPLLLNILDAVGSPVATDIAIFLNNFPNLLKQSIGLFEAPDSSRSTRVVQTKHITYSTALEVHSLALILYILTSFRDSMAGIIEVPEVQWDAVGALENAEFWLGSRHVLRERIFALGPREVEWSKQEAVGFCKNRLEEKVVNELTEIKEILLGDEA